MSARPRSGATMPRLMAKAEGPADVAEGDLGQLGDDAVDRDAGLGAGQLVDARLDLGIS